MASIPRNQILYDNCSFHLTWQCHNNSFYLKDPILKKYYYNLLLKYKGIYEISIYSYCLMDTHIHFTGHCKEDKKLSDFIRVVNSLFARKYNKINKKRGQVCMDRFKSPVIESDDHLLRVMRYIDLNPVRAKMIKNPKSFKYSSYNHYAFGIKDPLITDSPAYLELGIDDNERQMKYRDMVDEILNDEKLISKKESFSTTLFIGNPKWVIEKYEQLKKSLCNKKKKTRNEINSS